MTCGGYVVTVRRGRVAVRCRACGPCGLFSVNAARTLAARLAGVLGRFETPAPPADRLRLAEDLRAAARRAERAI